ncbi:hypothetical protein [Methylophilus sp. 5]|uniref:hypothetical protein n=1 Tax=Methylophilus sp. 5 TaxID=1112274 RepID=UPI0012F87BF2|nr:hypothetical protein [Methylophilus sp. 5]
MKNQPEDIEDIFKGIDAALRRAAQTARRLAEQNGTPYVVHETQRDHKLHQNNSENKQ